MYKRILLFALSLLLMMGLTAQAEEVYEKINDAMYRIVLRTEQGDTTLGSGVLFQDQRTILTASSCCAQGELYAIGSDGSEYRVFRYEVKNQADLALLTLEKSSPAEPLAMADLNGQPLPFLFGANAEDNIGSMPMYGVRKGMYGKYEALIFASEEGLLPGSFMADSQGRLVGLVIAQHMEGMGMYAGLDASVISEVLYGESANAKAFLDTKLGWVNGQLYVTWMDSARTGGMYLVTISGGENAYYTTYEVDVKEKEMYLNVPSGHTYFVQVQWVKSAPQTLPFIWDAADVLTLPLVDFRSFCYTQECHLVSIPAGKKAEGTLPEMKQVTAGALTDPDSDIYLQITSSYDAEAEAEIPMSLELIAPDGQFYFTEMSFVISPDRKQKDVCSLPLDEMIASCVEFSGGELQQGQYRVRYFICGQLAGECVFTLQEGAEAPAPAPAEVPATGFAQGLTAQAENGLVTLTWDADSIPAGAKVNVFYFYEDNSYYSYKIMTEGASSTKVYAVPGRSMTAWVVYSTEGEPTPMMPRNESDFVTVAADKETPLIAHGFKNLRIGLAPSSDPSAVTAGKFLPQPIITRKILSDRSIPLYFQTEDTYRVSATSQEHPLVIVLMTPEGLCFVDAGYYRFELSLQKGDLWLKDVSKLFADYESLVPTAAWPAGKYRILYCIDGKVAGEFTFTLN